MIFATYWFQAFAVLAVTCYWLLPVPSLRLWWLAVACLTFHAHFAGPAGMAPIIVLMIITYFAALSGSRRACVGAMALCVLALCFYKYTFFLIGALVDPWSPALGPWLSEHARAVMPAASPLGM